jgi:hypothetical protein
MEDQFKKDLEEYVVRYHWCRDDCKQRIQDFLKTQPPQSITVYRGQKNSQIIKTDSKYPWFSTSLKKDLAKQRFANEEKPCCLFTIHLVNVPTIDVNNFIRHRLDDEKEHIVLGGGAFYQDAEYKVPGFKTIGEGEFEAWYTIPPKGARRTRRKKLRKSRRKHKQ